MSLDHILSAARSMGGDDVDSIPVQLAIEAMQAGVDDVAQRGGFRACVLHDLHEITQFSAAIHTMAAEEQRQDLGGQVAAIEDHKITFRLVAGSDFVDEGIPLRLDPSRLDVLPA